MIMQLPWCESLAKPVQASAPLGGLVQRGLHSGLSGFGTWTRILQFGGEMGSQENDENVLTKTHESAQEWCGRE